MSIMIFVRWFRSETRRAKYGVDHPAFLAAKETWDYQQARIEALEAALEMIAGKRQCLDNTMSNVAIAVAALQEGEK